MFRRFEDGGYKMEKELERYEVCLEAIKIALANTEEVDTNGENIAFLAKEIISSDKLVEGKKFDLPDNIYFVRGDVYISKKSTIEKSIHNSDNDYVLYIVVENIADKLKIVQMRKKYPVVFIYAKKNTEKIHIIHIDSRLNSMLISMKKTEDGIYPRGQIFVAKVKDLVELYERFGDALFKKNVRNAIERDTNDVEQSIRDTLAKEPQNFWFYNNGITILADKLSCEADKSIKLYKEEGVEFSVINGANFFYNSKESDDVKKNAENAYVLLRVITIIENNDKKHENRAEKISMEKRISVSLNRQKPIDNEDLAMNSSLVSYINSIYDDNELAFLIVRKGEEQQEKSYSLFDVAKYILSARLQTPWEAKNAYKGNLLKMKGDKFKREDVFPQVKEKEEFSKNYGFVNVAANLEKMYRSQKKNLSYIESEEVQKYRYLLENGEYYFIACVFKALGLNNLIGKDGLEDKLYIVINKMKTDVEEKLLSEYKKMITSISINGKIEYDDLRKRTLYNEIIKSKSFEVFKDKVTKLLFTIEEHSESIVVNASSNVLDKADGKE